MMMPVLEGSRDKTRDYLYLVILRPLLKVKQQSSSSIPDRTRRQAEKGCKRRLVGLCSRRLDAFRCFRAGATVNDCQIHVPLYLTPQGARL